MRPRAGILLALVLFSLSGVLLRARTAPSREQVSDSVRALLITSQQAMLRAQRVERAMLRSEPARTTAIETLHAGSEEPTVRKALGALLRCVKIACQKERSLVKTVKSALADEVGTSRERLAERERSNRRREYELFGVVAAGGLLMFGFLLFAFEGKAGESFAGEEELSDDDDDDDDDGGDVLEETLRARLEQLYQVRKRSRENARFAAFGEVAAGLSHGLKTPLACVRAATQVAQAKIADDHAAQKNLDDVIDEVDGLVLQINSFLKSMGGAEATFEELDLAGFCSALDERYRNGIASRDIRWEMRVANDLPTVLASADLLEMAMRNLIDNAFEASGAGSKVVLTIGPCAAPARVGIDAETPAASLLNIPWLEIAVLDEGVGIAAKTATAERPESTRVDGSGLGIAIARRIAARFGGALELAQREHEGGTRASFFLPPIAENAEDSSEPLVLDEKVATNDLPG